MYQLLNTIPLLVATGAYATYSYAKFYQKHGAFKYVQKSNEYERRQLRRIYHSSFVIRDL